MSCFHTTSVWRTVGLSPNPVKLCLALPARNRSIGWGGFDMIGGLWNR
jgi:hypothetical protein